MALRLLMAAAMLALAAGASAATIDLVPSGDNTLYEVSPDTVATSNGAGTGLFVGNTDNGDARRAVLTFDLAAIPQGCRIDSVVFTLQMNRTQAGSAEVRVHRLLAAWGEGASVASGNGGRGAAAAAGDATWLHRFFPDATWALAGGDFAAAASARIDVGVTGTYAVAGPGLTADVQAWLDQPAANHGWILVGDEATVPSAKRFASREAAHPAARPRLTVWYTTALPAVNRSWGELKGLYR